MSFRVTKEERKRLEKEANELTIELTELLRKRVLGEESDSLVKRISELEKRVEIVEKKLNQ